MRYSLRTLLVVIAIVAVSLTVWRYLSRERGPILTGRIHDDAGQPIADVKVIAHGGAVSSHVTLVDYTDEHGQYRFDPIRSGIVEWHDDQGYIFIDIVLQHAEHVERDRDPEQTLGIPTIDDYVYVRDFTMARGGTDTMTDQQTEAPFVPGVETHD